MKKLLLISALLIFACSSDDSNDNSNQTFLEKYNGVVWKEVGDEDFISFSTNGLNECIFDGGIYYSDSTNWGENYEGYSLIVLENSPEKLVLESVDVGGIVNMLPFNYITTIEVTNSGNSLVVTSSDYPNIENYDRVSSNPCD